MTDAKQAAEVLEKKRMELVNSTIWSSIMEATAWCGWTNNARDNLVKHVQEQVQWALSNEGLEWIKRERP